MVKKNSLFELIQALTPAEKRHFTRSISAESGSKNYLRLFREMEKMNVYDESVIREKFKGERFIKQLHVTKIYLQDRIMRSLRDSHTQASVPVEMKDLLKNISIYFSKELFNQCAIEVAKALKLASRYEDDISLLEVLNWKRKLVQQHSSNASNLKSIVDSQASALSRLVRQNELWSQMCSGFPQEPPIVKPEDTLTAKVLIYHVRYLTSLHYNRHGEALLCLEELLAVLEECPYRIEEDTSLYLSTTNNLASFYLILKKYDAALRTISRAKSFYNSASRDRKSKGNFRLILRTYNIEMELYRDTESLDSAASLTKEIQLLLEEHTGKFPPSYLFSFWFQFAVINFSRRDFKQSLRWINEILNSPLAGDRKDLVVQAHLLNLMTHLELKNFFVMRYFVGSAERFFKRIKMLKPHHKLILAFFKKISSSPESEHKPLFKKLFNSLFQEKSLMSKEELDFINWESWIKQKISKG